ncbi:hypothetical protein PROFUN_05527 [Planoprotostelium fungivorum]|uniref:Uncharacterized protein n=1 Tax=Planoprotostelium fungivorum TaxID=1890364 RepID=A0A2P6NR11_9EUKA|nr:hypothetical protein PROFUN_05527 [Planoprotostelium fungivorum]
MVADIESVTKWLRENGYSKAVHEVEIQSRHTFDLEYWLEMIVRSQWYPLMRGAIKVITSSTIIVNRNREDEMTASDVLLSDLTPLQSCRPKAWLQFHDLLLSSPNERVIRLQKWTDRSSKLLIESLLPHLKISLELKGITIYQADQQKKKVTSPQSPQPVPPSSHAHPRPPIKSRSTLPTTSEVIDLHDETTSSQSVNGIRMAALLSTAGDLIQEAISYGMYCLQSQQKDADQCDILCRALIDRTNFLSAGIEQQQTLMRNLYNLYLDIIRDERRPSVNSAHPPTPPQSSKSSNHPYGMNYQERSMSFIQNDFILGPPSPIEDPLEDMEMQFSSVSPTTSPIDFGYSYITNGVNNMLYTQPVVNFNPPVNAPRSVPPPAHHTQSTLARGTSPKMAIPPTRSSCTIFYQSSCTTFYQSSCTTFYQSNCTTFYQSSCTTRQRLCIDENSRSVAQDGGSTIDQGRTTTTQHISATESNDSSEKNVHSSTEGRNTDITPSYHFNAEANGQHATRNTCKAFTVTFTFEIRGEGICLQAQLKAAWKDCR